MYRWLQPLTLGLVGCILAINTALWSSGAARAGAPVLMLEPDRGRCPVLNPPIVVRGKDFEPDMAIVLLVRRDRDRPTTPTPVIGKATVAADGTFTAQAQLVGCDPNTQDGTQFVIHAA